MNPLEFKQRPPASKSNQPELDQRTPESRMKPPEPDHLELSSHSKVFDQKNLSPNHILFHTKASNHTNFSQ